MKITFMTFILATMISIGYSQKLDTLYYDSEWFGVESKEFAYYIRYVSYAKEKSNYKNRFKTYYTTGELQAEGEFVSIDRYDDSKSIMEAWKSYHKNGKIQSDYDIRNGKGKVINYYENGNIKEEMEVIPNTKNDECRYVLNGSYVQYWENGLIHIKAFFKNGVYDGICYSFTEDGQECAQYEYTNGEILKPYFTYVTSDGTVTKYKVKDNTPFLEMPTPKEKQTFHNKGTTWDYYNKNGLTIMVNASLNQDYGKYITLTIVISNNSNIPIVFNPSLITAYKEYKGKISSVKILTANEYINKVSNRQNWSMFFNAFNESMAASKAGYSASLTQTSDVFSGQSISGAIGAVVSTNGVAVGTALGGTSYSGYNVTSSSTVNYNGAAAYQAELIASGRIADYNSILLNERNMKEEGYLKITTLNPKESISGYLNIPYSKGDFLNVNIVIDSIIYPFAWDMSK